MKHVMVYYMCESHNRQSLEKKNEILGLVEGNLRNKGMAEYMNNPLNLSTYVIV